MTQDTKAAPRRAALPAATLAMFLLAGCSSGNIGESWQCPLAAGGSCDSVAAADPAVPVPAAARETVLGEPLWRVRAAETDMTAKPPCAADCDGGFDPFAWLARLFGGDPGPLAGAGGDDSESRASGPARGSVSGAGAGAGSLSAGEPVSATADIAAKAVSPPAPSKQEKRTPEPEAALLPAEPGPAQDGPDAGDLRTDEVVARIWIAPFVDADGVYREASYIRVVLEPAGWRLK